MAEVGTRKVFENDKIIVWELELEQGERLPLHTHSLDYLVYVISGSTIEVIDADGNLTHTLQPKDRETLSLRVEGEQLILVGSDLTPIPATHSARNAGENYYREILIETKSRSQASTTT